MNFAKLHDLLMERINFAGYFATVGVEIRVEADDQGWVECASIFSPGRYFKVNTKDGTWSDEIVHPESGSIYDFIIQLRSLPPAAEESKVKALGELCLFAGLESEFDKCEDAGNAKQGSITTIDKKTIEKWKAGLRAYTLEHLTELTGLNLKTVREYNLGWIPGAQTKTDRGNYFVPIPDWDGTYRSARLIDEDMEARWAPKSMQRMPRTDRAPKLYGCDQIFHEDWKTVIVCQSEFDRLILMQERERQDWGAVSLTDNNYLRQWDKYFAGRSVVICFHTDRKSITYAECVLAPIMKQEKDKGNLPSIKLVNLPTAGIETDKAVIHWFKNGGKWRSFQQIIESAQEWIPPNAPKGMVDYKLLESFSEIDDPVNTDMKVQVPLCVSGETNIVYDSPTQFEVEYCAEIQAGRCELCVNKVFDVDLGRSEHIAAYNSCDSHRDKMCRDICCKYGKKPKIRVLRKTAFREVIACQNFNRIIDREGNNGELNTKIDGRYEQLTERRIYIRVPEGKSEPLEPRGYLAVGWIRTNPKNSARTLLVETLIPLEEGHEAFRHRDHLVELQKLREMRWKGILHDLTQHVTMIFGYDELLLITLLTYCSPLWIRFNGEKIRGWITAVVIGDSGVGKSKVFERISELIGVGDIFSCLTGRRTGLTYSIVKTASNWRCQAGLQPRNTRKILCVEEAQDMPQKDIKSMAIAMDRGILDVEGVARGSYESMTRLIFNCNAATDRTLGSYAYGCQAMRDLFSHMFIRRIDIAAFVRRMEKNDHYNRKFDPSLKALISGGELRSLIYYAWNLTPDRIFISDDVTELILKKSNELSNAYGGCDDIPLVCPSDFRKTLARLAVAWAVLDLSTTDDFQTVNVNAEHVTNTEALIRSLYSNTDCALDQYSEIGKRMNRLEDYPLLEKEMINRIGNDREAFEGKSAFPRLLYIFNRGMRHTKWELKKLLSCTDAFISDAINFLASNHFISGDQDEKLHTTPKYNRFYKRFAEAHPDHAAIVNLSADMQHTADPATSEEEPTSADQD